MELEPVIGLEIHIQLKTLSKMFSPSDNRGEAAAINTTINEIDLAHPGTLPVANKEAVIMSLKMAIALECTIPERSKFDRKHYFYPDLTKAYQISQYDEPLGTNGSLVIYTSDTEYPIRIHRLHLEEDAAKLFHDKEPGVSVVDYNRGGTPLMEIVTEPDIKTPKQANLFLRELRMLARALGVSDADMEKGHLRCDANISLRPKGEKKLYPKTEVKNLNSFKAVEKALEYETKRLTKLWETGEQPTVQSTRGWDESKGETIGQREKEDAQDYRYFPDPDLPPMTFDLKGDGSDDSAPLIAEDGTGSGESISEGSAPLLTKEGVGGGQDIISIPKIKNSLPELPQQKRARFMEQYGFSYADAYIVTEDEDWADFTEQTITELRSWLLALEETEGSAEEIWEKHGDKLAQLTGNWLINNLAKLLNESNTKLKDTKITPENFAELLALVFEKKVNSTAAQTILDELFKTGNDPASIVQEQGLEQVSDIGELDSIIKKAIDANTDVVKDYKSGKENAVMFLVGAVMKESKGKANPQVVKEMLIKKLK
ncbi:MAG: Asp-tRNA(Asn)/Glu-tRNA(Gln) amidotransferase subunit GatB [Candidatus Jacksonbacteria bacterium]|jgi:aspartyl-tRNA(Asn)/glutamyl-tRNA(Gln) amidotransferase subunit B|nr:Asp-tRNA(Asn)/Glu-tRNA(Gln) amidotransferase subunit GatB [Candidatus Jacksonbacteria bacterium]MBT6756799.1 Asp-tRNA(Asn)/Glu-tRNA(Gln) amidotransferase subunit GatB [Candidatus Jacksonbacteria bacterium]MBT6954722.1 Asp-tRNA(Asn)/Glu-tRNA(Gln) amidotransferase subunit GatB [Candidatus Jacksonbacteria bacterium]